jgi:hypothetical protein
MLDVHGPVALLLTLTTAPMLMTLQNIHQKLFRLTDRKKLANTFMKTNNGFPIFSRVCLFTSRHLYWPGILLLNLTAALNMGVCDNETSKYSLKIIRVD